MSTFTNRGALRAGQGLLRWESDTFVLVALDATDTPTDAEVRDLDTVAEALASGTGSWVEIADTASYSRQTLTIGTVTQVDASDWALVPCANVTYTAADFGAQDISYLLVVKQAGTQPVDSDEIICGLDSDDFDLSTNSGNVTVAFTNGIAVYRTTTS